MNSSIIAILISINVDTMGINMEINKDIININMTINLGINTYKVPYVSYPLWQKPEIFGINSSNNAIMISISKENMDIKMDIIKDTTIINMDISIKNNNIKIS